MNKKLATVLFIIGGTALNIILMLVYIVGLLALAAVILRNMGYEPGSSVYVPAMIVAIFGGLVLAFFTYSKITKYIQNKYELEKYLEPLFRRKR